MDIGFRCTPDINPFLVLQNLSKDNVLESFNRFIMMSSFPISKPFLMSLLILNKFTQTSSTNIEHKLELFPFDCSNLHLRFPIFVASMVFPFSIVILSETSLTSSKPRSLL
jgi:hypothetical protein